MIHRTFFFPFTVIAGVVVGIIFSPFSLYGYGVLAFCIVGWVWARKKISSVWTIFVLFLFFFVSAFRGSMGALEETLQYTREADIRGVIVRSPRVQGKAQTFFLKDDRGVQLRVTTHPLPRYSYGDWLLLRCAKISEETCLSPILHRLGEGKGMAALHILFRMKERLVQGLHSALPEPHARFAVALLLGERTTLPEELTKAFAATGTTHIIAVSGMHVVMLSAMVTRLLRFFTIRATTRRIALAAFLVLFTVMIGAPASAVRGLFFGLIFLLQEASGRPLSMSIAIATTAALLLFVNPSFLVDLGFQLSFLAVVGIVYGVPMVVSHLPPFIIPKHALPSAFLELAIIAAAATLTTTPLLAATFGQLSLISILANVLIVPFVLPATILAVFVTLTALILPPLAALLAVPLFVLLHAVLTIVELLARLPLASITITPLPPAILAIIYTVIFVTLFFFWSRLSPWERIHSSLAQQSRSS